MASKKTSSHQRTRKPGRTARPAKAAAPHWVDPVARRASGKALRAKVPRSEHAAWAPQRRGRDPVGLLMRSNEGRLPALVPIRFGRMLQSPFAFYRGAASIMSHDLARTPVTGLRVQACGDCHLVNFGGFATPERRIILDINDFDETLPAPWEWDLKRLCASFVVAARHNGHRETEAKAAARAAASAYRQQIDAFAGARVLDVWYARIDVKDAVDRIADRKLRARMRKRIATISERTVAEHDFPKLTEVTHGSARIKDDPPLIFHSRQDGTAAFTSHTRRVLTRYRETLPDERRILFDRFHLVDVATKVVGVGSVGTVCAVALFMASDSDPLFLQIKEARESVLEPFAGASSFENHGQRVVTGQRMTQSASDIFLGWTFGDGGRHYYIRQLRDVKLSPNVELFDGTVLADYGEICGQALAKAHARTGDAAAIAGYLGGSEAFDEAMAKFAVAYADQTERDFEALKAAAQSGRIEAHFER